MTPYDGQFFCLVFERGKKETKKKSPDTVEEVAVIVSIDIKFISQAVIQNIMAVLEVVEDTQDGTVVVVWG